MSSNKGFKFSIIMPNRMLSLLFVFLKILFVSNCVGKVAIPGHLEKLGSHTEPQGMKVSGLLPQPRVFYQHFVKPGKPLLMKGGLFHIDHPGLSTWTDQYLRSHFGSKKVQIETRRVENRDLQSSWLDLDEFLKIYRTEDMYMIHSLARDMKDLALVPQTLHCGGFQNMIQDVIMWLGSGNMTSVLHRDSLDNLLCLLDGQKDIVLIDKAYKEVVEGHGFEKAGGYSRVDPLAVDMEKFPNFQNIVWHEVNLKKGDCIFIPQYWYHQVNSHGDRHMSVNIWLAHLHWFDSMNCSMDESFYKPLEPVSTFGFASPNEIHRSNWLSHFKDAGFLTEDRFHMFLPNNPTKERANELFQSINEFSDPVLSWGELYSFDIDKMLVKFPDLFGLAGDPYNDIHYDRDERRDQEDGQSSLDELEEIDSNSGETFDDQVPLPDALSIDENLLPDDSIGLTLNDVDNKDSLDEMNNEEKSFKVNKDEL